MDIPREKRNRTKQRIFLGAIAVLLVAGTAYGLSRLSPAAPTVEKGSVWTDTVKRGPMLREVRGTGTLVPEDVRFISAVTDGVVERLVVKAGATVTPETVILEMRNPEVERQALDAEWQMKAAEADFVSLKARLAQRLLDQKAQAASVSASFSEARLQYESNQGMAKEGLVSDLTLKISKVRSEELATRWELEKERLAGAKDALDAELDAQHARIEQLKALLRQKINEAGGLKVRAGLAGVLQQVPVQPGQRVTTGTTLAKVARPDVLKAELRIAETQAKDVTVGEPAAIDTRNGIVEGRVARIDPAVLNGTVTVDVTLTGALPPGARPDLTVDGTIELEKLSDVLFTGRPAFGQPGGTVGLFRLDPKTGLASRTPVKLGRSSVHTVEILDGLAVGDTVILSDMSSWDAVDRVKLK